MDKKWWTLLAVCLGTFMLLLDVTIVNVALPAIQSSLKANFSDLQWVVDAYALSLASLLLTSGSLADLFGRRVLFAIGLVIFTAGSLLCGLATSPLFIILSRAAQGIGGAIMFATSLALIASAFQGRERGVAFGVWGAITGVAVAVGPVLGGLLTTGFSWRWIFFVNLPIGAFALAVTLTRLEESREAQARRPDWAGFVTFTAALIALVYGLIRAQQSGWSDTGVIACFVAAVVGLAVFLMVERRGRQPMFELSLFRLPTFAGGSIAAFAMSGTLFALLLYLVLYLQDDLGFSALGTGVRLLVLSGGVLATSTIAGRATARVPVRWLIAPGLALVGIGLLLMAGIHATSAWTHLIPGFILAGVGTGMINPPLASTAVGVVEPRRAGMASGINATFRQVGIATGIAALGTIFTTSLAAHVRSGLDGIPQLAGHSAQISVLVGSGDSGRAIAMAPAALRGRLGSVIHASFADGLNGILVIGGIVALVSAVLCLALIRQRDFAQGSAAHARANAGAEADGGAPSPLGAGQA
jgi:EmrB/QacA subfamily drug resistance transporter